MSTTPAQSSVTPTTPYSDLPEWLSPKEVADYLRLSPWTVYQGVNQELIPYKRVNRKLLMIPKRYLSEECASIAKLGVS